MKPSLRFFLNHNFSGYLQGLSKEMDANTNSIRVELYEVCIKELCRRVEELTGKSVNTQVRTDIASEHFGQCLLVWTQQTHEGMISWLQAYFPVNNRDKQAQYIPVTS